MSNTRVLTGSSGTNSPRVYVTYRSLTDSSRTTRGSFSRDGRVRQITPRRTSYWRRLCSAMPWKNICVVLLLVLLSGVVVPLQMQKKKHKGPNFVIEDKSIGNLKAKVLTNTKTGEYAEVVVDFGGRVEELHLRSRSAKGTVWSVLLSHNGNATAIKENTWWKGMLLLPWANRIDHGKYDFFGKSYQLPVNENTSTAQNALHGFLANKILTVKSVEEMDKYARLELAYSFDGTEPGYPFFLDIAVFYTLSKDGFNITIQASNRDETHPLPFFMGWHPYFNCTSYSAYVTLDPCTPWNHIELDSNMDPTGNTKLYHGLNGSAPIGGNETHPTHYDDGFKPIRTNSPDCSVMETVLNDTKTGHTVVLWQDSAFKFVQVFTGLVGGIAIEPMSAAADAYNNHDHLAILSGGEIWTGSFGVYIK